jgi:hypothetical protein
LLNKPFSNSASILKFEFGDEKGSNLKFASFQNCSTFYTKTLKTQNTKVVALKKFYKLGCKLGFWILGFRRNFQLKIVATLIGDYLMIKPSSKGII